MQSKDVEWISIEDKLKKEWKKQDACKKEEEKKDKKIISYEKFKAAHDRGCRKGIRKL